MIQTELVFLKLGGSLITQKDSPMTPRLDVIRQISTEIAIARKEQPDLKLLIGHGSGSYGHVAASRHQTHLGGSSEKYWHGFAEVWRDARELNQIIVQNLSNAGLPVMAFPPSAGLIAANKTTKSWDVRPLNLALSHGLIPIVQGDVIFDEEIGGTIFSTEKIFHYLGKRLYPAKILIAGIEAGVYANPDSPDQVIPMIRPDDIDRILPGLSGSETVDVTGGMLSKVRLMLSLVQEVPQLKIQIFSGNKPGNIRSALAGNHLGTLLSSE
jgi:isopentenyl phosphate kinase